MGSASIRKAAVRTAADGCDDTRRRDLPDLIVAGVGDIDITSSVHGNPRRRFKPRGAAAAVARLAAAGAGEGRDDTGKGELADDVVTSVGDVDDAAHAIDRDGTGFFELRLIRGSVRCSRLRGTGDDRHLPVRYDRNDLVMHRVGGV